MWRGNWLLDYTIRQSSWSHWNQNIRHLSICVGKCDFPWICIPQISLQSPVWYQLLFSNLHTCLRCKTKAEVIMTEMNNPFLPRGINWEERRRVRGEDVSYITIFHPFIVLLFLYTLEVSIQNLVKSCQETQRRWSHLWTKPLWFLANFQHH